MKKEVEKINQEEKLNKDRIQEEVRKGEEKKRLETATANLTLEQLGAADLFVNQTKGDLFSNGSASKSGAYQNQEHKNITSQKIRELEGLQSDLSEKRKELSDRIDNLEKLDYTPLGSLHTITYSSFREKFAVRGLGRIQAKAYTRGPRTIAGTLIFNTFQEHELIKFSNNNKVLDANERIHPDAIMLDQMEPFNLLLLFANEFGAYSSLHLLNVDLSSEGQEMSVDQVITHNTLNFYATDMIPMTSLGNQYKSYSEMLEAVIQENNQKTGVATSSSVKKRIDGLLNPFANPEEDEFQRMLGESRGLF